MQKLTFEFMKDVLERIATEYPSVVRPCHCDKKGSGAACSSCEITFLLNEFTELSGEN